MLLQTLHVISIILETLARGGQLRPSPGRSIHGSLNALVSQMRGSALPIIPPKREVLVT